MAIKERGVKRTCQACGGVFYDLLNDPNEMKNLWNEPRTAELQKQMLSMMWSRPGIELNDFDDPIGVA